MAQQQTPINFSDYAMVYGGKACGVLAAWLRFTRACGASQIQKKKQMAGSQVQASGPKVLSSAVEHLEYKTQRTKRNHSPEGEAGTAPSGAAHHPLPMWMGLPGPKGPGQDKDLRERRRRAWRFQQRSPSGGWLPPKGGQKGDGKKRGETPVSHFQK